MPFEQRLPIVNNDDGVWGDIIRQYLMKEHFNDDTDNVANGGHKTVTIRPGTATAGTAPLKFSSGTLLSTPEAGAVEFNADTYYVTQTTGTTRKKLAAYDDSSGATGDIYYRDASGYFTRLAAGTNGHVLQLSSGLPSWQPAPSGAVTSVNTYTGAVVLTKSDVGLGNVDDTSDATKNAATATLTNKTLTAPVLSGTVTGTYTLGGTPTFPSTVVTTTGTQTLTNKTLTAPAISSPTGLVKADVGLANVDNTSDATKNSATATLTNKTLTAPVISSITNTGTLTLPTATDTLVGRATTDTLTNKTLTAPVFSGTITGTYTLGGTPTLPATVVTTTGTQTLTNKTLTAPVISSITNTGTLTLPTATDTLVGRATTDTLTNKTLTAPVFSGTITGTYTLGGTPTFPSTVVTTTGAQTLTNKTLTAPAISSPTGLVKADVGLGNVDDTSDATKNSATATLTNKTISGASNTLSNIAQSSVTSLTTDLADRVRGTMRMTAGTTAPVSPAVGDVWLDTN